MKVIIDTSSLLSLVRYYLPFDENHILYNFIKEKIEKGEIIVIDKVYDECQYFSQGLVLKSLEYLKAKEFQKAFNVPFDTEEVFPPDQQKFSSLVDNNFVIVSQKNRLASEAIYEIEREGYLKSADMRMIMLCLNELNIDGAGNVILVTEESEYANDNKLFKKIPAICKILGIQTSTLPELLAMYDDLKIEFSVS